MRSEEVAQAGNPDPVGADRARMEREHAAVGLAGVLGVLAPLPLPTHTDGTGARLGSGRTAMFPVAPGAPVPRADLTTGHAAAPGAFLTEIHEGLPTTAPFEGSLPACTAPWSG